MHIYQFAASLSLAVVLISSMALALIFATFVEATFNTDVVQFYVYRSWWFGVIYGLLALNIFCAAAIRYPWKRHQTGFVITHVGLLMLLFSGVISRSKGIDAQVHVWENRSSELAFDNAYYFDLQIDNDTTNPPAPLGQPAADTQRHALEFAPGMFNWSAYDDGFAHWRVARPDLARWFSPVFYASMRNRAGDVLYNQNGVKLEVVDYYADCDWKENTPTIELRMSVPAQQQRNADGTMRAGQERWMPIELSVFNAPQQPKYRYGIGDSQRAGGGSIAFWMAGSPAATKAFLNAAPEGEIGANGQVVLNASGKRTIIDVADKLEAGPQALEGTDLKYDVKSYFPTAQLTQVGGQEFAWAEVPQEEGEEPKNPTVIIDILRGDEKIDQLTLLANMPQMNMQGYEAQVFGDYWYDFGEKDAAQLLQGDGGSRIDLIQGVPDGVEDPDSPESKRVFYRYWNRKTIVAAGELPLQGNAANAVDAFSMPIGTLRMYLSQFIPAERPKPQPRKLPFGASEQLGTMPASLVRLTIDGESEEFWLRAHQNEPDIGLNKSTQKTVKVGNREVKLSMPIQSYPIGFRIYLEQFERRLDPGTSQPSHYSSDVHYLDRLKDRRIVRLTERGTVEPLEIAAERNPTSVVKLGSVIYWLDVMPQAKAILRWDTAEDDPQVTELVRVAGLDPRSLVLDAAGQKLWWLDVQATSRGGQEEGLILQANLDGSERQTVARFPGRPSGLAVDSQNGWVFFADPAGRSIGRVKTDGSELDPQWLTGLGLPTDVVADPQNKQIYYTDDGNNAIGRAAYEEPKPSFVHTYKGDGQPNSIALDLERRRLYWTDTAPNGIDPRARKHLNDPAIARGKPREINTLVRMLDLNTKDEPQRIHYRLMDQPQGITVEQETGEVLFTERAVLKPEVWITMNAPDDFIEPAGGRDLRIFQESFNGPFLAGTPEYREFVPERSNVSEVYKSVFSVNYDPGTALRYWGCIFVIGGIACMFYMRAYFFKPKRTVSPEAKRVAPAPARVETEVVSQ